MLGDIIGYILEISEQRHEDSASESIIPIYFLCGVYTSIVFYLSAITYLPLAYAVF